MPAGNAQAALGPRRKGVAVLSAIWLVLVLGSVAVAAWTGRMPEVSKASLDSATSAIDLVVKLVGSMMVFLGLVRVASEGGLLHAVVRGLRPLLRRLFPDVPEDHPAMGAITMNFAANILGLGNAATPFGLKAMLELDRLNPYPGVTTNAMALFLAINTSSIVLMAPSGTVAVRLAAGSQMPFAIWVPTLIATTCSTVVAVGTCLLLQRMPVFRARPHPQGAAPRADVGELPDATPPAPPEEAPPLGRRIAAWIFVLALAAILAVRLWQGAADQGLWPFLRDQVAVYWLLPLLIAALVLIGFVGGARVYDAMIEGGREGLEIAVRIAPFLVAILVAVGMFRASGALHALVGMIDPVTSRLGVPAEALPMALLRPLTGSGAFAVMAEILKTHGPDSFVGLLTSTLQGSTETTFYVLAVYLGAAGIRDVRHVLIACLAGDLGGFIGAVVATHLFFG